jgi:hypothetical protein
MRKIHPVAYHEFVRTFERREIGIDRHCAFYRLIEQHAGQHAIRATPCDQIPRDRQRPSRLQDVVDDENIASGYVGLDVADDLDPTRECVASR